MPIINNTGMIFTQKGCELFTQVVYDFSTDLTINKSQTYLRAHTKSRHSGQNTIFEVHDLNEKLIRESKILALDQTFSPTNAISFLAFVKNSFKSESSAPQTVARFSLPRIKFEDKVLLQLSEEKPQIINFTSPVWKLRLRENYTHLTLNPQIESLVFYPSLKQIKATLLYLVPDENADILIEYGEENE